MKTQLTLPKPYPPIYSLHILGICLTLITACSVFKDKSFFQADSLQKQDIKREVKTGETVQSQAVRIYSLEDSSDKRSFTEIFPEGIFSYSTEEGFRGNAKRVLINESSRKGSKLSAANQLSQTSHKVSDLRESKRQRTQTRLKEKTVDTDHAVVGYLLGLLLVFVGVYLFRGKLQG